MHVESIQREVPELDRIPSYYRAQANDFGCWFKVVRIEKAEKSVMSKCVVCSSGKKLSLAHGIALDCLPTVAVLDSAGDPHEPRLEQTVYHTTHRFARIP